jgi:hypothetical protein
MMEDIPMAARTTGESVPPQWVVDAQGQVTGVLIPIEEYRAMQEQLGEMATREEEASPEALRLLSQAKADMAAGWLVPHAGVVKRRRPRRTQSG